MSNQISSAEIFIYSVHGFFTLCISIIIKFIKVLLTAVCICSLCSVEKRLLKSNAVQLTFKCYSLRELVCDIRLDDRFANCLV